MPKKSAPLLAVGLMSGTSMDGVDAALVRTNGVDKIEVQGATMLPYHPNFQLLLKVAERAVHAAGGNVAAAHGGFSGELDTYLHETLGLSGAAATEKLSELKRWFGSERETEVELNFENVVQRSTEYHAAAVHRLLDDVGIGTESVDLVGYHGQTVYHRPAQGITVQLGDGAWLAGNLGIQVVNDFRSNDVKHGGQGAPLAPIYHRARALQADLAPVVVINCGGISNPTIIGTEESELTAFDAGPGSTLIDRFVSARTQGKEQFDRDGGYALQGNVNNAALEELLASGIQTAAGKNYLELPYPKSLDTRDCRLTPAVQALSLSDGCATLAAFSAECLIRGFLLAEKQKVFIPERWILAGGGWKNRALVRELEKRGKKEFGEKLEIQLAEDVQWNSDTLEAELFAYLAVRALRKLPLSFPGTTGVAKPVSGGVLHKP